MQLKHVWTFKLIVVEYLNTVNIKLWDVNHTEAFVLQSWMIFKSCVLLSVLVNFSKQMRNLYLLDGETGENIPQTGM